jgi:hypothetical protein
MFVISTGSWQWLGDLKCAVAILLLPLAPTHQNANENDKSEEAGGTNTSANAGLERD